MAIIYHVTTVAAWNAAKEKGSYEDPSLAKEGFIHASEAQQVDGVLKRYFAGKTDLVKLTIDTDKLKSQLVYEWSPSVQEQFPHIYGPINLDAVISEDPL
ncbi:DUF952 domain-containing protein [Pinibacter aurantiacus]|uniref:DUF952 domain-containing protein n=1 Tax=Pinibacter aurantiacus TaxID=2851599 RepID=A0A9E2SBZ2_9BACT|nr:DUF952 domain-containing protein [Pinibacter aurantiacus]MBV4358522.1 DUF952 domain-containing protein [Pinibacter aurantiacus]